jgi:hypothetical protein
MITPAIAQLDAHHDRQKGRLARAIAAAQRLDLARPEAKPAILQRGNAAKGFLQAPHVQQVCRHPSPPHDPD